MKKIDRLIKNKKGSALLYVMIIVVILVMVVAVVLVTTANANRQSAFTKGYEKSYYAAESAAQMAGELFLKDFKADENAFSLQKKLNRVPTLADIDDLVALYKAGLEAPMKRVFQNAVDKVNEMEFNDLRPNLSTDNLVIDMDSISVGTNQWTLNIEEVDGEVKSIEVLIAAYLSEVAFTIQGTAGEGTPRTAEIGYRITGSMDASGNTTTDTVTEGAAATPDTTLGGRNGQRVNAADPRYNDFKNGLENLLYNASTYAADVSIRLPNMDYTGSGGTTMAGGTQSANTLGSSAARVYSNGNLTLNGALSGNRGTYTGTGRNNNIEYLFVRGNLVINGQVYMPKLKEVYVTGNVTISGGGRILAGNDSRHMVESIGMITGSNFVIGGTLQIDSGINTLYDCRFYVPTTINITGSNGGSLLGNSVYLAYGSNGNIFINRPNGGTGTNNYNVGSATYVPQFYAGRNISFYMQGNAAIYALMAAMGNIDRTGPSSNDVVGFALVGNGTWTGGGGFSSISVGAIDNLLDYGLVFNSTTRITTVTKLNDVVYSFDSVDVSGIREINTP